MGADLTTTDAVVSWGRLEPDPAATDLAARLADIKARLAPLVSVASDAARSNTSRALSRATYTAERYSGRARQRGGDAVRNGLRIFLREYPVNAVSAITENGTTLSITTGSDPTADVVAILPEGILERNIGCWSEGVRNIAVTYDAGWDFPRVGTGSGHIAPWLATDLPFDLEQWVKELSLLIYKEGPRLGEQSKNFATWSLQYIRSLNPALAGALQTYERGFRP